MTLTAKTYGDGRGMITSAWLPTKWFVIASAILNSNNSNNLKSNAPCTRKSAKQRIKTGILPILADVCAKQVVVKTLVVVLLLLSALSCYPTTSSLPPRNRATSVAALVAFCLLTTHTLQTECPGQAVYSTLIQPGFAF